MLTWFLAEELWSLHLQDHVGGSWQTGPWPTSGSRLFLRHFMWPWAYSFIHVLWMAVLTMQGWIWITGTEAAWPAKPEIDTIWPFAEKLCWHLLHWKLTLKSLKKHRSCRLRPLSRHAHTAHTFCGYLQWLKWKTMFSNQDCRVPRWVYCPSELYSCLLCLQTHWELCPQSPLISGHSLGMCFPITACPGPLPWRNPLPREAE